MDNLPKCNKRCNECLFHYTKQCVALKGDYYFIKITEQQAQLIIRNQSRFQLTKTLSEELIQLFPNILN